MVVRHKDIFFANIAGVDHGECHLDLYLPDKLQDRDIRYSDQDLNEEKATEDDKYDSIKEVLNAQDDRSNVSVDSEGIYNQEKLLTGDGTRDKNVDTFYLDSGRSKDTDSGSSGVPFVLFIHGGGWRRGGRAAWKHFLYFDVNFLVAFLQFFVGTYGNIGEVLAENNIACAVVSYPLTEAGPVVLLVEMLLSYIQSAFFVFVSSLPIFGILLLYRTIFHSSHNNTYELIFKENDTFSVFRACVLLASLITNIATSLLFFLSRRQFNISFKQIRCLSVALGVSLVIAYNSSSPVHHLVILTLVLNQIMIFYQRIRRHGSTYEEQVKAVAQAVKWAKCFSEETGKTDVNRLYLMGHSAGGHLVTLSALDESILASVACSTNDLKGVISISGVYDLLCLNKHWLRHVYLEPTFGRSPNKWLDASPAHLAKRTKSSNIMPKFLLMLAEKDLFLKSQSFKFARTLDELQVECKHVEIRKSNHFNIVTNTSTREGSTLSHVLDFVK
ncbi:uncharacterized protein LOC123524158 [Mercenaria mercenaria]|uniref:uncharacterized protein LOC123524158 n=1 Tax=Mercenaria mercenaria TaxID=6596 RepID=UPI00234EF020|nr:uncharacterized protein LOC123524158 [Mercenaria mercenaria]